MTSTDPLPKQLRRIGFVWLSLLALLLTSWGSATLHLGGWNSAVGLFIAAIKSALVALLFMHLGRSSTLARIALVVAACLLAVLMGLSAIDFARRDSAPVAMQQPRQLPPLRDAERAQEKEP